MTDTGNTAWLLTCAALVMLMTPGLALFYGGMVRSRSVLNVMMLSFVCLAVTAPLWIVYGYSLAFGPDAFHGLIGRLNLSGLTGVDGTQHAAASGLPIDAFAAFQLMFAVVTVALLAGAVAERTRFWPWILFALAWVTVVYLPVAHWIFAPDGWLRRTLGVLDFAGGTAVEVNSGAAALALVLVLGRRKGWPADPVRPHNLPFVLLGAGLLWFGWLGFNAGSALSAGPLAATALVNTMGAGGTGVLGWLLVEQVRDSRPTTLGAASGAVAGLVGITPACGYVEPLGALAVGLAAGVTCSLAVGLKFRFRFDDSLDVVAVHGVGGLVGMLMVGLFATRAVNPAGADGLCYGGGLRLLWHQAAGCAATVAYSLTATLAIAWVVHKLFGFRVAHRAESTGIDEAEHAESAYDFAGHPGSVGPHRQPATPEHLRRMMTGSTQRPTRSG